MAGSKPSDGDPSVPSVVIGQSSYPLTADRPFRFGRCGHLDVVGLDSDDTGISRAAGELTTHGCFVKLRARAAIS